MRIVFEPSGTHVHKDKLKIRLDLFPEPTEKSYAQNYVYVPVIPVGGYSGKVDKEGQPLNQKQYNDWVASLPHIWKLNPCLCVFVKVDQNITKELLTQFCGDIYKSDILATIDDAMIQANAAHLISPYMRTKSTLNTSKTSTFDDYLKNEVNTRLAGFNIGGTGGTVQEIQPQSIDIGTGATDRNANTSGRYTWIGLGNPANADGTLDTYEVWANSQLSGFYGGTVFLDSGSTYECRDFESIGTVTSGSKQTFTSLSMDVVTGDYLAWYSSAGDIESATSGSGVLGNGALDTNNINLIGEQAAYETSYDRDFSIYATGTEGGGPDTYTETVSMSALLKAPDTKTINLGALLKTTDSKTLNLDTLLRLADSKNMTLDSLLRKSDLSQAQIDMIMSKVPTISAQQVGDLIRLSWSN